MRKIAQFDFIFVEAKLRSTKRGPIGDRDRDDGTTEEATNDQAPEDATND